MGKLRVTRKGPWVVLSRGCRRARIAPAVAICLGSTLQFAGMFPVRQLTIGGVLADGDGDGDGTTITTTAFGTVLLTPSETKTFTAELSRAGWLTTENCAR